MYSFLKDPVQSSRCLDPAFPFLRTKLFENIDNGGTSSIHGGKVGKYGAYGAFEVI